MEKTIDKIYEKLYDITSSNMYKAGKELAIKKDAFMYRQKSPENVFDVSLCGECDNVSFLQIAYLGMLGRMPDPGAVVKWTEKAQMEQGEFRRQLIEKISMSEEFARRDVRIMNNIYNTASTSSSKKVGWYGYAVRKVKQRLYYIAQKGYRKLPEKIKRPIKKSLGR